MIKRLPEYKFDFTQIKKDVFSLVEKYNYSQIGLTHSIKTVNESIDKQILESSGSAYDFDTNKFRFSETDFTIFNEEFKTTSLYEMYKTIPNIGRFRIMIMDGPKCYTIHRDLSKRYHYVIETNDECLFIFPDINRMSHIPCDQHLYLVDTKHRHTFLNGSRERRIHLVMDDLSSL